MVEGAISFYTTGANITTGVASASIPIPTASSGIKPNYIRVSCTVAACVKPGASTVAATSADLMLQPAECVILKVQGATHIAAIQVAAAGVVNVVPLEDM